MKKELYFAPQTDVVLVGFENSLMATSLRRGNGTIQSAEEVDWDEI